MPLEGVVGGSGHSWNRLSHYYGLYLDHCKLSSLLQSFRCGLHGQIKENFSGGVANYRYCQTNSPFLYTLYHSLRERRPQLLSDCFILLWPITAKIKTPKQVTKPQKIAVVFHTWLASSCTRIPELYIPGVQGFLNFTENWFEIF